MAVRPSRLTNPVAMILAAVLFASCASPPPQPIDPVASDSEFRSRTLADPCLRRYLDTLGPYPTASWDLPALTRVAFYFHPELDIARARLSQAQAGIVTAGARPNPSVGLSPGYSINPGKGVRPWILGFGFDIPLETAGRRGYRIEQAERLADAACAELAQTAWEVRSRLRAALLDHLVALRELELARTEDAARVDATSLLERKRAAGDVSRSDVEAARVDVAAGRLAVSSAEGRVADTRVALAAAMGVPPGALDAISFTWTDLDHPPSEAALSLAQIQTAGLLNRIDVRKTLADYGAAEAALQLEVARQYPDVNIGPGYEWDQGQHKFSLALSFTLPVFNQNEGPIAEAVARRREVAARFLALQARVISATEQARVRYHAALAELANADDYVSRQATYERVVSRSVTLGEEDPLALTETRIKRVAADRARLDALHKAQAALGAMEDAVQRPLSPVHEIPPLPADDGRTDAQKEGDR